MVPYTAPRNNDRIEKTGGAMRIMYAVCLVVFLACATANADPARPNLKNLDKPILLDAGNSPRMYVIFNHASHKEVKCRICHHEGLPGTRYASCTSEGCHSLTGARERDPMSVYMAYHAPDTDRSCYGCHKKLSGSYPEFKGCKPCHLTPSGRKLANQARP